MGSSIVKRRSRSTSGARSNWGTRVPIHEEDDIPGYFETLPRMFRDLKYFLGIAMVSLARYDDGSERQKPILCSGPAIHTGNSRWRPYDHCVAIDNGALPACTVVKMTAETV